MTTVLATFPSKSNPEITHTVSRGNDGVVYCSCPGWRYARTVPTLRSCTHTKSVAAGSLAAKAPVVEKATAGHLLATAAKRAEARTVANRLHKALMAGGEAAKVAAATVLMDTTSGFSKNLRALALSVMAK